MSRPSVHACGAAGAHFLRPVPGAARTAMVTGASSGIGEAFARRLARAGYDLILVARRQDRLAGLCHALSHAHGIEARAVAADLAAPDGIAEAERAVGAAKDLELLVSNAGFGTTGPFASASRASQMGMLSVHAAAGTALTHAALPGMLARGRGGIIHVASVAAWAPVPGNAVYAASKLYLVALCHALHAELAGSGVHIQALCPGFTRSGFHDTPGYNAGGFDRAAIPGFLWLSADRVAAASLAALGNGRVVVVPGVPYRMLAAVLGTLPKSLLAAAARRVLRRPEAAPATRAQSPGR